MTSKVAEMTARVRGEDVAVRAEATVCSRCNFQVLTDEQSDAYTVASADAYRKKHNLLTTRELKEIRQRLGMSLRVFAQYLSVGEASPKRWEAGLVQDNAMDELIRLKTNLNAARENLGQLEARLGVSSAAVPQTIIVHVARRETDRNGMRRPRGRSGEAVDFHRRSCSISGLPRSKSRLWGSRFNRPRKKCRLRISSN